MNTPSRSRWNVPKIVMNDRVQFEGALPEAQFLEAVVRAASTDGNR